MNQISGASAGMPSVSRMHWLAPRSAPHTLPFLEPPSGGQGRLAAAPLSATAGEHPAELPERPVDLVALGVVAQWAHGGLMRRQDQPMAGFARISVVSEEEAQPPDPP